jgi:putative transposase
VVPVFHDVKQYGMSPEDSEEEYSALRKHERTGRPLGSKRFVGLLEEKLGRVLKPQKGGRQKKQKN